MEKLKIKKNKVGRPKLNINSSTLEKEMKKYLAKEQSGVATYKNLGIGKTSFYAILKDWR